jgi:Ca-activated chloride channel family protein
MRYGFAVLSLGLFWTASVQAQGLLVPADKDLAPLAMVNHDVSIRIEDQVAVTKVTQTFRNPTSQQLEATYLFPVPKGASVKKFVMWVDGKEVAGELVEADKARTIYTDIVRRIQDPGLLEYVGSNLLRLRVFPIPPHGDQKLAVSFTSIAEQQDGLVEYVYPLRTSTKAVAPLEKFTLQATLRAQHALQNIYSPSHAIQVERIDDHQASVRFEAAQTVLDKDFQLFYTHGSKDVELTLLTCRPEKDSDGTFMLLISPRAELSKKHHVARDMVFVLDTSGSMQGAKIEQAKKALKFCLGSLSPTDRFALMNFSTTVNKFADALTPAGSSQVEVAKKWVDKLEANGGTAIDAALDAALATRTSDQSRPFTIVFFTDGQPTVGETNPDKILEKVLAKNTANTRIFTFGVGDDVNAALLDQLADKTRAVSTYVRPAEDIEVKTSGLVGKISHPVLTNLKLTAGSSVTLSEIYPTNLPDLFHGSQLVMLGRYHGNGHTAITLTGSVGKQTREFVYDAKFPAKTTDAKSFVVDLWARRKVGYLLEQIRSNGEKKELVDEVIALAKKHGIATPYTSLLVVPDNVARPPVANVPAVPTDGNQVYQLSTGIQAPANGSAPSSGAVQHAPFFSHTATLAAPPAAAMPAGAPCVSCTTEAVPPNGFKDMDGSITSAAVSSAPTTRALSWAQTGDIQTGKLGVDVALVLNEMRNQNQVGQKLVRQAAGRTCCNINGVWADQGFDANMKQVTIKAMSAAYFRMLERHPEMKAVFQLGTQIVWVTPSGCGLVIDPAKGAETMSDAEIDALFVAKK